VDINRTLLQDKCSLVSVNNQWLQQTNRSCNQEAAEEASQIHTHSLDKSDKDVYSMVIVD